MTKIIFELETEVGKCDYQPEEQGRFHNSETEPSSVVVHTQASLNGRAGVLKIEQQCYLRQGTEVAEQPWVKPNLLLEPATGTTAEMIRVASALHERFVQTARQRTPENYLV